MNLKLPVARPLTAHQAHMLTLWAERRTYRDMAHALGVEVASVYPMLRAIKDKIGCLTNAELQEHAVRAGLLDHWRKNPVPY